ncbi:PAS domain-containing protein [Massilia sp. H-1]|nr:PAS domain-containing protein [Massilia sp. H-1]
MPEPLLLPGRALTITLYALSSLALYLTLFGQALSRTHYRLPLQIAQWLCLPLLVCSIVLPYNVFLPLMWVVVACALLLMTLGLVTVMLSSNSRVAFWFAASFAVTFLSGLSEVIAAALGIRELIGLVNSVTAALASSLLAALAVAEQMRLETQQRIAAQAELEHAYEAMPVGLFTLDLYGHFLSTNPALCKMLGTSDIVAGRTRWKQFLPKACGAGCTISSIRKTTPSSTLKTATAAAASWCGPRWRAARSKACCRIRPNRTRPPSSSISWPTTIR